MKISYHPTTVSQLPYTNRHKQTGQISFIGSIDLRFSRYVNRLGGKQYDMMNLFTYSSAVCPVNIFSLFLEFIKL